MPELQVKITGDASALKAASEAASEAVDKFKDTVGEMALGALGAVAGIEALKDGLKESVTEFASAEKSAALLTSALKAQALTSDASIKGAKELAEGLARQSQFTHVAIEGSERLLISLGHLAGDGLERAEHAAVAFATATGRDLGEVTTALIRAQEGHTTALQRWGLQVGDAEGKGASFSDVLEALEKASGDAPQAQLDTYAGKIDQFQKSTEALKESIGSRLAPELETLYHSWGQGARALAEFIGVADSANGKIDQAKIEAEALDVVYDHLKGGTKGFSMAQLELAASLTHISKDVLYNRELTEAQTDSFVKQRLESLNLVDSNAKLAESARLKAEADDKAKIAANEAAAADAERAKRLKELNKLWDEDAKEVDKAAESQRKAQEAADKLKGSQDQAANKSFFEKENVSSEKYEQNVQKAEFALKEFEEEMQRMAAEGLGPMDADQRQQWFSLKDRIDAAKEAQKEFNAEQKETKKDSSAVTAAIHAQADGFATAMTDIITHQSTAKDQLKSIGRQMVNDVIKLAITEIMIAAGIGEANATAQSALYAGLGSLAIGAVEYAAIAAMAGQLPGFKGGGIVGGEMGSDANVVRVSRGEEILTEDDPRHRRNGGGRVTVHEHHWHFETLSTPTDSELRRFIRDRFIPAMQSVQALG